MVPTEGAGSLRRGPTGVVLTIALLLAVAVSSCAFPEEAFDGSLEGTYYVNGFDQRGGEYGGVLTITTTADPNTYDMQWIVTGSIQEGVGLVDGHQLLVEWDAVGGFDVDSRGSASYTIGEEGKLEGERTVAGQDGVGTEEAFPVR